MSVTIVQSNTQVASNSVADGKGNAAINVVQIIKQFAKNFAIA